jgi:hypothetical protein
MSLLNNPSIVTNGLVFNYDVNNNKSYRSPPIRNILNQITPRGMSVGTLYNFSSGTENVYIPALGWINNCQYVDMYNDFNGGSNNCCPSPYGYGDGLAVSPSTLYTYAIVYKSTNGYTHPNYMYHYEYASNGSYLTEYGVFGNNGSTAKIRSLGDDWFWASATFTSNASAATMNTGSWMYEYGRFNRFHVAKVMLVPGNYIDMHPSLWPELNTTVSNTQAILDLTVINTITANSLTYASDGTFSFNGSSNFINLNNNIQSGYTSASYEFWCRPTTLPGSGNYFQLYIQESSTWIALYNVGSGAFFGIDLNNGSGWFDNNGGSNTGARTNTVLTSNTDYHVAYSWNGSTVSVYLNGNLQSTTSTLQAANGRQNVTQLGIGTTSRNIGSRYDGTNNNWVGTINSVRFYNRALTAAEVQQNFQALRGRYGI